MLVRSADLRRRHNGDELLKLTVGDRTGTVTAILTTGAAHARELCATGTPIRVTGRFSIHERYGPQLTLDSLRARRARRVRHHGPARRPGAVGRRRWKPTCASCWRRSTTRTSARLLELVFGEGSPIWAEYRDAPAAKHYHQAYRHGLLEHSLSVAQSVSAISATFGGIDREIAVTGALLHDIGKLEAYEIARRRDLDVRRRPAVRGDPARLLPRPACDRGARRLPGRELAQAVLHIILSHHGSLEHGSPVVPCTREATLVHMIDNLGGKLGSFDRVEKSLAIGRAVVRLRQGDRWRGVLRRARGPGAPSGLAGVAGARSTAPFEPPSPRRTARVAATP